MKIQSSIYNNSYSNIYFQSRQAQDLNYYHSRKSKQVSPLENGLKTATAWFGFGVALDFFSRKFTFFKSPFKNSLALNSIIGLGAGGATIVKSCITKNNN